MVKILLFIIISAALCDNAKAQCIEGAFNKLEISANGDTVLFNFVDGSDKTAVFLINRIDSLKTRISGDHMQNKFALKEENGIKILHIYLRPKWKYDNINGMGFGKAVLIKQNGMRQIL